MEERMEKKPDDPGSKGKKHGKNKIPACLLNPGQGLYTFEMMTLPRYNNMLAHGRVAPATDASSCDILNTKIVSIDEEEE